MSDESDHDVLSGELRDTLTSLQKSLTWVQTLTREAKDVKDKLKQLEAMHRILQDEYQKSEHNLKISESMVVQLSVYIKKNCPAMALYEALKTPPAEQKEFLSD
jgi:hypothetical protein